jgi:hypothetical protein
MASDSSIDTICLEAQSFQHQLVLAKTANPVFASAMLGSAVSASKSNLGSVLIGGITLLSTHYGFNWDNDTVVVVSGGVILISNYIITQVQLWKYRKTLPVTTPTPVSNPVSTSASSSGV